MNHTDYDSTVLWGCICNTVKVELDIATLVIWKIIIPLQYLMRWSKGNFNIPLPRANLGHSITFCAPGVGNLIFLLAGWRKFNRKCKVSNDFFFLFGAEVANSYKNVFGRDGRV